MNVPNLRDFIEQSNRRILDKQIELNRLSRENDMVRRIKELEWENHLLRKRKNKEPSCQPYNFYESGSNSLSQKPISSLTLEEAKEAFNTASGYDKDQTFEDWLNACSQPHEAKEAYYYTSDNNREDLAFKRWLELCEYMSDVIEAYKSTSKKYRENWAFERLLELCKNPSDAKKAYEITSDKNREDLAFKRWLELCSTESEAREAYNQTNNSQREEWAREKIRELGGDI